MQVKHTGVGLGDYPNMRLYEAAYGSCAVIDISICLILLEEAMDILSPTSLHINPAANVLCGYQVCSKTKM